MGADDMDVYVLCICVYRERARIHCSIAEQVEGLHSHDLESFYPMYVMTKLYMYINIYIFMYIYFIGLAIIMVCVRRN